MNISNLLVVTQKGGHRGIPYVCCLAAVGATRRVALSACSPDFAEKKQVLYRQIPLNPSHG